MNRNKSIVFIIFIFFCCSFASAEPYGRIIYAEGNSFTLIRGGTPRVISVESSGVFGMEIKSGDIFQTAAETMLEFAVNAVGATVKIAENTSFRCGTEPENKQVTGELYYGRVRAKVNRLARGSTYRISSPSLVAGVRGTDFGLDVVSLRVKRAPSEKNNQEYSTDLGDSAVLHRVFCFEGSVLVSDFSAPKLNTVLLSSGEKIERLQVLSQSDTEEKALEKEAINKEIREFWEMRPFSDVPPVLRALSEPVIREDGSLTQDVEAARPARSMRVPAIITTTLMVLGGSAIITSSILDSNGSNDWIADYSFSAGVIMIGTELS